MSSRVTTALVEALRDCEQPASTAEVEARMTLALSQDPGIAVQRTRIALLLESLLDDRIERLPEDRWRWRGAEVAEHREILDADPGDE